MVYLYRHIRLDKNEVFYVGIGAEEEYKRAYSKADRNKFWRNVTNKTEYEVEIMLDDLTWEEACLKEQEFIKLYGRKNLQTGTLVNLTNGGDGSFGLKVTDETKQKISKAFKGRVPWNKGIKWKKKKPYSEELRKKIGDGQRGRKMSDAHKAKISAGMLKHFRNG